jgi:hypothetical protein
MNDFTCDDGVDLECQLSGSTRLWVVAMVVVVAVAAQFGVFLHSAAGATFSCSKSATLTVTAPKLTERWLTKASPLHVSRVGSVVTVSTRVAVNKSATLTLAVRDPRTGRQFTLQPGSRLGDTLLKRQALTVKASIGASRTLPVKALLAAGQVGRGSSYQLTLSATGTAGRAGRLLVRFLG